MGQTLHHYRTNLGEQVSSNFDGQAFPGVFIDHAQHLSGRVGKPSDIAKACLYLTDSQNDFVTGINLVVDGGMTRKMIYT